MLNKIELPGDAQPDDVMVGRCQACSSTVQCLRRETELREVFGQMLPCTSCPRVVKLTEHLGTEVRCGARVYVGRKRS